MPSFDKAVDVVLRHEGGYANDPDDTPTNFGITLAVLQAWRRKPVTQVDVMAMPVEEAKAIYKGWYWALIKADAINEQDVATRVFDMAVLRGVPAVSKTMQQAAGVTADAVVGPKTLAAINAADPATYLNIFRSMCVKAFGNIAVLNPRKAKFLNNWLYRAEEMTDVVSALSQRTPSQAPVATSQPGRA